MAINYGTRPDRTRGGLSFQQLGQQALDDTKGVATNLPTSPFAAIPRSSAPTTPLARAQINPAAIPEGFQFTGEFDAANRGYLQEESDAGLQRRNTLQSIADAYLQGTRKAETTHQKSRRQLFESLADKGAIGSGASLNVLSEYDTSYNDYLNDLSRAKAYDEANIENSYASILNQLGRKREGLVGAQQKAEQDRLLAEAETKRLADQATAEAETRRQQLQEIIDGQIRAAQTPVQSVASHVSYSPPSGGYDFDAGGGGGYSEPAYTPPPEPVAPPSPDNVYLPGFTPGTPRKAVEQWVRTNVDPNMSQRALKQVTEVLIKAGGNGVSRADLGWLVQQYPNQPGQGNGWSTGGIGRIAGRR